MTRTEAHSGIACGIANHTGVRTVVSRGYGVLTLRSPACFTPPRPAGQRRPPPSDPTAIARYPASSSGAHSVAAAAKATRRRSRLRSRL
jgi:hypothetical protein